MQARAAIDVGSNSVHLLVARVADGHDLEPLLDESTFLGLGDRVARDGLLGAEARGELVEALRSYGERAVALGAAGVEILGTEPIRRAADAARLGLEVVSALGFPLLVLSHEEEAALNLVGVTGGRDVGSGVGVVDIGGGSTEVVVATRGAPLRVDVVRTGTAHLTAACVRQDPPREAEVAAMRALAQDAFGRLPDDHPGALVAVGGAATNLARLHPEAAVDRRLTLERLRDIARELGALPAAALVERHGLNPRRAPLMAAGAVVVEALLGHYGLDALTVSGAALREGAVLVAAHDAAGWRDRLPTLVLGWG